MGLVLLPEKSVFLCFASAQTVGKCAQACYNRAEDALSAAQQQWAALNTAIIMKENHPHYEKDLSHPRPQSQLDRQP